MRTVINAIQCLGREKESWKMKFRWVRCGFMEAEDERLSLEKFVSKED